MTTVDRHSPEQAAAFLRERARVNREYAHIPPQQWEANVLQHWATRFAQIAQLIEELDLARKLLSELRDAGFFGHVHDGEAVCWACRVDEAIAGSITAEPGAPQSGFWKCSHCNGDNFPDDTACAHCALNRRAE